MTIGIIGAGAIGSAFARALANRGIEATIANSRGPQSLAPLVAELGPHIRAASVDEAASADMVLVAVNWSKLRILRHRSRRDRRRRAPRAIPGRHAPGAGSRQVRLTRCCIATAVSPGAFAVLPGHLVQA
jgi:2-polyprenyl-6-methoxyphenol hydroxylase-like FAD-dependent oxidoreductase